MNIVEQLRIADIIKFNAFWFFDAVDSPSRVITLEAPGNTRHGRTTHRTQDKQLLEQATKLGFNLNQAFAVVTHSQGLAIAGKKDLRRKRDFQASYADLNGKIISPQLTIVFGHTRNCNARTSIHKVGERALKLG